MPASACDDETMTGAMKYETTKDNRMEFCYIGLTIIEPPSNWELCMFGFLDAKLIVNLSPQVPLPGPVPTLAMDLDLFFWTRWPVLGMRPELSTVPATHLAFMTVPTLKMLESPVKVCVYHCITCMPQTK